MSVAACTDPAPTAESHAGIATVTVEETPIGLSIRGLSDAAVEVARLDLELGTFYFDEFERVVFGRQLVVSAGDEHVRHESAGTNALRLPAVPSREPRLGAFLVDPRVRPVLARWGIEIEEPREVVATLPGNTAETPSHACTYTPSAACRGMQNWQYDCKERGEYYWVPSDMCVLGTFQAVCCEDAAHGGTQNASYRRCGFGSDNPCGAEGAAGCAVCWVGAYTSLCNVAHSAQEYDYTCWAEYGSVPYTVTSHDVVVMPN